MPTQTLCVAHKTPSETHKYPHTPPTPTATRTRARARGQRTTIRPCHKHQYGQALVGNRILSGRHQHPVEAIGKPPPPPPIGEEIPTNQQTNRRTDFSAKQVPGALDLSPRPQTHLPFSCSVVGVMWKPKISLNFRKKKPRQSRPALAHKAGETVTRPTEGDFLGSYAHQCLGAHKH